MGKLVSGLAAVIAVMAAVPAFASAQFPPPPAGSTVTPNPAFNEVCGDMKIMLSLDESASISAADLTRIRNATDSFIRGLEGSDTELGITAFALRARNLSGGPGSPFPTHPVYQRVTAETLPDLLASMNATIPGAPTPGFGGITTAARAGTNWQDAFRLVREDDAQLTPGLVLFMTDGNPNAAGSGDSAAVFPPGTDTPATWQLATPPSIAAANTVKEAGSRIFALGVGAALSDSSSRNRLGWITGGPHGNDPTSWPDENPVFRTADFHINPTDEGFDELAGLLGQISSALCRSSLEITKHVANVHGGPFHLADGWHFTTTLEGTHTWLTPLPADHASPSATQTTGHDAPGVAVFEWQLPHTTSTVNLSVHEAGKPGFHHVISECIIHRLGPNGVTEVAHPPGGSTTGIPPASHLGIDDWMTCDVYNSPPAPGNGGGDETDVFEPENAPHLVVHKTMPAHAHVGDHVPVTITVRNIGHGTANDVVLRETRPGGLRLVAVANHGSLHNGTAVWHLGHLAPGHSRTVHATALVLRTGLHPDTAVASASNADPAFSNAAVRAAARGRAPAPPAPAPPAPPQFTG